MDIYKKIEELSQRVQYAKDILGNKENARLEAFGQQLAEFDSEAFASPDRARDALSAQEQRLAALESQIDDELTAMDKVRVVRHPQRICLKDILENVYDNYTEIGGRDEHSIDPGMLIARAYITRRVGSKVHHQPVMVVGQEKGHGEEYRNGGSIKPWGNANALKYMKVAAREGIPIHTFVFTPGSYPVEDFPGAAQQIAENIYEMSGLSVPIVAVFSEGGSGGAEAIGLADRRLMLSHGYYSVISPEGAAAIEGRIRQGQRAPVELIEKCALHQRITADDNLQNGYIDRVITEPALGARPDHFDFFRKLRSEVIQATDEICLSVRPLRVLSRLALRTKKKEKPDAEDVFVRWSLGSSARERLVERRQRKFRGLSGHAWVDSRTIFDKVGAAKTHVVDATNSLIRYRLLKKFQQGIGRFTEEVGEELSVFTGKIGKISKSAMRRLGVSKTMDQNAQMALTCLSDEAACQAAEDNGAPFVSQRALEDREYSCPNAKSHGCLDVWARDLFTDFAGVCPNCGHHFPMEYHWYLANVFDQGTVREFNKNIEAGNPTRFPDFDQRLQAAKDKTGLKSACVTFNAELGSIRLTCAMLTAPFRGGSVGAAEGEKFIRALEMAERRHQPFLAYVHGTAGIRIQEGVNGLIQMPRVTVAVRRYIEAGGLYIVLYDTNSYAGPVASFLGCSPYQYAVRSSRLGFAGPGVIKETTGMDIAPDYHNCFKALKRGHIQDVWDRREIRRNLHHVFLTIGGRNLYYR